MGAVSATVALELPLVAVGGPAGVYYPEVANRLGAKLFLPDDFVVANAVGAALGQVVARGRAEVHGDGPGSYRLVGPHGTTVIAGDGETAIEQATEIARSVAETALAEATVGIEAGPPTERVDVARHQDPDGDDSQLYGARVEVELRARPYLVER